ncbi:MAG: hypothetical protein RMK91_00175 [Pseudanabaenaceae cyanobacterium SKYGB_i_bin29]|nr:hypothetical protein [Pseudanabaenaceae cyanobacterium SKYG29]MDW8420270.1 hypothetical protein [Pseudanabaenaceae cyanobacterium SKYGB_i_bin29]
MNWQVIYDPPLPLTMYRELAAHLSQIEGVQVELLAPRTDRFDYNASQVGGINIVLPVLPPLQEALLQKILHHYGNFRCTYDPDPAGH